MGVQVRLVVYAPDLAKAEDACRAAFQRYADLDSICSDYRINSELNRLCAQAGGPPIRVSRELFFVLQRAYEMSVLSNGAFDVTVGPIVRLWREARKSGKLPDPERLKSALSLVGYKAMVLDKRKRTVKLVLPGMQLDLGGIAKGYANDEAMVVLKRHGIRSALIESGGDILVSAAPPNETGWRIGIPDAAKLGLPYPLMVHDCAVSTSGDSIQNVIVDGKHYSHVVNPFTGIGLTDRLSATVIHPSGIFADAFTKAVYVLGIEAGKSVAKRVKGAKIWVRVVNDEG